MAGNANSGRRKTTFITDALLLEVKARENDGDKRGLRKMAVTIMDLAEGGERWAAEYIRDTLDGKPAQRMEVTGEDGGPLEVSQIIRKVVDPRDGTGN
jgi:hypothetical protein